MAHLRKDQTEALLSALDSATSGPLEEITIARERLSVALCVVLETECGWTDLITAAADLAGWSDERRALLAQAARPDQAPDPEALLEDMWDLVTELNERRSLG